MTYVTPVPPVQVTLGLSPTQSKLRWRSSTEEYLLRSWRKYKCSRRFCKKHVTSATSNSACAAEHTQVGREVRRKPIPQSRVSIGIQSIVDRQTLLSRMCDAVYELHRIVLQTSLMSTHDIWPIFCLATWYRYISLYYFVHYISVLLKSLV